MQVIVDTYGAKVSVKNGMLCVLLKGEAPASIPFREIECVHLGQGVSVTSNALRACIEHNVRVLIADRSGQPVGHVWHGRFGSTATIRRKQILFSEHPVAMQWIREGVLRKIGEQVALCYAIAYQYEAPNANILLHIQTAEGVIAKIKNVRLFSTDYDANSTRASFRGWEGTASRAYFKVLSLSLPASYKFEQRERRPAADRFNCALNYMYGILYGLVEIALIKAGIDPYIGVLHTDGHNKPSMVLDAIEPYRIWADRTAYRLCHAHELGPACFDAIEGGGLWLSKEGKKVVLAAFFAYLDEVLPSPAGPRKRKTIIELDAQRLAQLILHI